MRFSFSFIHENHCCDIRKLDWAGWRVENSTERDILGEMAK